MNAADVKPGEKAFYPCQQQIDGNAPDGQQDENGKRPHHRRKQQSEPEFRLAQGLVSEAEGGKPETELQYPVKKAADQFVDNIENADGDDGNDKTVDNVLRQADISEQGNGKGRRHQKCDKQADFGGGAEAVERRVVVNFPRHRRIVVVKRLAGNQHHAEGLDRVGENFQ